MKQIIKGFIPHSLVDWDGKVSAVIFLGGCNFRCSFCSNKELVLEPEKIKEIDFEKIKNYLKKNNDFIDAVIITGGEPTIQKNIMDLCKTIKDLGFKVKIDTNGSNPEMLDKLLKEKLLDCVAMDIKAPPYLYSKIVGDVNLKNIEKSIKILNNSKIDFEFRITMDPFIDKEIRFFNNKEIEDLLKWILDLTKNKNINIHLQRFISRDKKGIIDERLATENLNEKMHETPEELLKETQKLISKYFSNCKIRNI